MDQVLPVAIYAFHRAVEHLRDPRYTAPDILRVVVVPYWVRETIAERIHGLLGRSFIRVKLDRLLRTIYYTR